MNRRSPARRFLPKAPIGSWPGRRRRLTPTPMEPTAAGDARTTPPAPLSTTPLWRGPALPASMPPRFSPTTIPRGISTASAIYSHPARRSPTSPTSAPLSLTDHRFDAESAPEMRQVTFTGRAVGALVLGAFVTFAALFISAGPAAADFRLCNNTASRVGIAVGYKDADGWTTEGWWNLPARTCETVLKGNLVARYYYVYAIDYDSGGDWMGH